ncbi:MAG: peptidase M48 [Verrucomicrobia bacterium CG_4_10_14_3_um_filter_43_23]|nr:MAG: peptidase M48 [Verrucomicrobia bacterium CG1_02_43_26]PIP59876.1 MAG: peptidase M48 [Verrucomicrobia bacterium CG22_combo_CG10-13_8_21_14_all_43_17]PIX58427.1 MAG: peptidase M48 [Verrucomicrobia bacterium CG_4_10_14_3_um_filter_43_23]PIY61574.1 MAG: peptidase M48 [Verrucomicrobia bacterium CG_4_10_14_0_8_um_filter_43_34]PJA43651.1 MAG: peptidase M48 [Verrucomicrobia bacterium CG_4_9_14_3_um_filter_43_20]
MNTVLWIFVALLVAKLGTELFLAKLNANAARKARGPVPDTFSSFIDQKKYDKSIEYTLAKNTFGQKEMIYDAAILAIVVLSGILPVLYNAVSGLFGMSLWAQSATLITVFLILSLPSLPFEWYNQFKLEERFGFNKSTKKLWITDKFKGIALSYVLGVPIIWVLLRFFQSYPQTWWLWGFLAIFAFQILMLLLYPRLILPLFNKLTPLEEGETRERLMNLADRAGFKASTIEVMDGSKRSGHSNAFFTGFGRFRHIVLFDTLMKQLSISELESVLAHEIGHYKMGHIPKMLVLSASSLLITLGLIAFLVQQNWFYESFGFEAGNGIVPALLIFSLVSGLFTFWLKPFMSMWSRKHEYEADAFAKNIMGGADDMVNSLHKLHTENLSNLTPHPLFSKFYYSHPTLIEREKALLAE